MKRIYPSIMLVAAVALTVVCIRQRAELRDIRQQLESRETDAPVVTAAGAETRAAATEMVPEKVTDVSRVIVDAGAAGAVEETATDPAQAKARKALVEFLKDPARQDMARAQWAIEMDGIYGALLRALEVNADELEDFKSLLIAKLNTQQQYGIRALEAGRDEARQFEIKREREQALAEMDAMIREYLGDEAYAEYEGYEKSLQERMVLADCKQALENMDLALTWEQEDELIRMMYEERLQSTLLTEVYEQENDVPDFDAEKVDEIVREFEAWRRRVEARSGSLLSSSQQEVFEQHMRRTSDQMKFALTAAAILLGEGEKEEKAE